MIDAVRRLVLGVFVFGLVGLCLELLLLGHDEGLLQLIPLALAGLAVLSLVHLGFRRTTVAVHGFQAVMGLFVVAGIAGAALHFRANVEFQREVDPALSGLALVQKALRAKAPPALAPGAMIQLGLVGFVYALRYPTSSRSDR